MPTLNPRFDGLRAERGQVVVMFALMIPVFLALGAFVIGIGNWYTHAKHLQTKADAAAFAGGSVWGFPCGPDVDSKIETQARTYVGPHMKADNTPFVPAYGTTYNPQVGGVGESQVHAVLNGSNWYDDDSNPFPNEWDSPASANPGEVCDTKILDVKVTEDNSFPLFSLIPLFPDIKRKARVEIDQVEGLSGLLPISVRVPKPASAAAVFYDESDPNRRILGPQGVRYLCETTLASLPPGLQSGLNGWTNHDYSPSGPCSTPQRVSVARNTGVVIALSIRPRCDASASPPVTTNCLRDSPFSTVDEFCRQGSGRIVQCFFGTGTGASQSAVSGLQFVHGYDQPPVTDGPPALRGAWLTGGGCSGGYGSGYFSAVVPGPCSALLNAQIILGSVLAPNPNPPGPPIETRTNANTQVRWKIAYGTGNNDDICGTFGAACDMAPAWNAPLSFDLANARYSIALRIRVKNTTVPGVPACSNTSFNQNCEWYYTGAGRQPNPPTNAFILANPVQRSFMGDDDRSGPIKFLRLSADRGCDSAVPDFTDNEAASQPLGQDHCFDVEIGLKGALAKDQDEPPIVFNLKASQSAILDCDPTLSNVKSEIVAGCSPFYKVNDFSRDPPCPNVNSWGQMQSPPAPYDVEWPPYTCVLTQTGNPRQLLDGFLERLFGRSSPAPSCPAEGAASAPEFVKGRNYWHDANNSNDNDAFTFAETDPTLVHGNNLQKNDPRKVLLFMTAYDSFTGSGNELFPIVTFGSFYITGIGTGQPGGGLINEDPCSQGSSNPSLGAGNKPPPDLHTEPGGAYVWGHFINNVVPSPNAHTSTKLCAPTVSFMPCVAVLVE